MWEFSTDPAYQGKLDWARGFMEERVYELETLEGIDEVSFAKVLEPLRDEVKAHGLWAAHLSPELGGQGFGALKLGLLSEIIGRSSFGPTVFGSQAPDSGNAELIAEVGTDAQKEQWLYPLLEGRLRSAFSMTEPNTAGSDPTLLVTRAERDGDEWVVNGRKWYTSNGSVADFLVLMAVTDPEAPPRDRASMFILPTNSPGVTILRDLATMEDPTGASGVFRAGGYGHSEILYENVRLPADSVLGDVGQGFRLAQMRLGPGRIQHCMRWLGQCHRAFDMMCERSLSRFAHGSVLAEKGVVQSWIADSAAEILAARLMTLYAAWKIDQLGARAARVEISMIKYYGAQVLFNVVDRAIQVYGGLGYTTDMPLESMYRNARGARIYDGPDEVHRQAVARRILRDYEAREVPSDYVPARRAAAQERFAALLDNAASNL